MPGRVLFCGDRRWQDWGVIRRVMMEARPDLVIQGEAPGADRTSRSIARLLGIPVEPYPANWHLHGKSAGYMRNRRMLTEGKPDRVIAFHDNIHASKGTKDMCLAALRARLPVTLVRSDGTTSHLTLEMFDTNSRLL